MIGQAIKSVLAQIYSNWELIIINDGSTDNTEEMVRNYQINEVRIKYYYQENKGRSAARNIGIELSSGEYLCFLDDDDYYLPDFLKVFNEEINLQSCRNEILFCDYFEEKDGKYFNFAINKKKYLKSPIKYLFKNSNNLMPFMIPFQLINSEKFDTRFEIGEDFHILIRLLFKSKVHYLPQKLCVYKIHNNMTMENELKNYLFMKLPHNRLDMLNDLKIKYSEELSKFDLSREYSNKYNQIAYFYASACLKKKWIWKSLEFLNKIKLLYSTTTIYYYISIIIRLPYYYMKNPIRK